MGNPYRAVLPGRKRSSFAALGAAFLLSGLAIGIVTTPKTLSQNVARQSQAWRGRDARAAKFAAMPLSFEENRGQAAKDALFVARGNGSVLLLTRTATVVALPRSENTQRLPASTGAPTSANPSATEASSLSVLRLELAGANPAALAVCSEELPGKSNYFIGNDPKHWLTNVPNCAKVRYESVYPGVDLVYYGNHQTLENDYVLAPGADPLQVRVTVRGARSVEMSRTGEVVAKVEGSSLVLNKPRAYQTNAGKIEEVLAEYSFPAKDTLAFKLGPYDHTRPLIIDPTLAYSTFLGGSGGDQGSAITLDPSGNICVVGTTSSTDFPSSTGVYKATAAGGKDVFVTKLTSTGALVFSTYIGGTGDDSGAGIAADSAGNLYLTGTTSSSDFPTTAGVVQTSFAAPSDAFVTKLKPDGTALIYSTYLGGVGVLNFGNTGYGIAVDASGNAYVTGQTYSVSFPVTAGALQTAAGTPGDAFITKLGPDATSLVYSSYLGGSGNDLGVSVAVDSSGNAVVAGTTSSSNFPTVSPTQATLGGGTDAFVAKVNPSGTALLFSTYLGGSGNDQAANVTFGPSWTVFVTGTTSSNDFPTLSAAQSTLGGGSDAFVTELKADGSALVYSTYLGGSGNDYGNDIFADSFGKAFVVGATASSDFPSVNPVEDYAGGYDGFYAQVAAGGASLVFSSYLGGAGNDSANGLVLDSRGLPYIVGTTNSGDFPVTLGSYQPTFGKVNNAFVMILWTGNGPGFSPYPTTLSFSDQGVGTIGAAKGIIIRNMGGSTLSTSSITTTGDFSEADTCGVVSAASECNVAVRFSPSARGPLTGTITFTDNAPGSPHAINLSGNGISPVIALAPNTLTFPSEPLNTTAPTQTISMNNSGVDASTITSIFTDGDFTQTNNCATGLAASSSCIITIAFKPTLNGTRTGTLTVYDNAPGSPHTVALTGTGVGPDAKLSAASLNFADQPVGTTSGPQVLTLTNDGSAGMTIASINTIGVFADTTQCGTTLAAGANCAISLTFAPTAEGLNSGALTISDNAPGSPHTVTLIGNALKGPAPVAYISPTSLTFGLQAASTTSANQTVTVTNTGNAALNVTQYNNTGPFTMGTTTCGTSLAAGANCTTQVAFSPTAAGPASGTYSLNDNASGSPHVVTLTGGGTDFGMGGSPATTTVAAGSSATYTLTLQPGYGFNNTINLTCSGAPQAATCTINPNSVTLDGTNNATATITVTTTARNAQTPVRPLPNGPPFFAPFGGVGIGLLLMMAALIILAALNSRARARLVAGILLLVLFWGACAVGNQKITGTLPGNFALTITGAYSPSGSGGLQHAIQVGLTVN